MSSLYGSIGVNYSPLRQPDPRIARVIDLAFGNSRLILNVGAVTDAYEPADRQVIAVEPSLQMIENRRPSAAPAIQASAYSLPFEGGHFDASMVILTLHR